MQKEMKIIDTHAHLTSNDYKMDAISAIEAAKEGGIEKIFNICTEIDEFEKGLDLEKKYPGMIYNIGCTTPHDAEKDSDEVFSYFEKMALSKKMIAIGESGFDDFIEPDNREFQLKSCRRYIDLAIAANLPIVFHVRGDKSYEDLFKLATEFKPFSGIIHCFTGNTKQAEKALDLGWTISISGIATFKKSTDLRETIKKIPLDRIVVETDSPWLAPTGYRGKDNQPLYVKEVIKTLSEVYGISFEEVCKHTYENAMRVFLGSS